MIYVDNKFFLGQADMLFQKKWLKYLFHILTNLFFNLQVKTLENHKNHLLELLNEQAEEKGKRAERLEKVIF